MLEYTKSQVKVLFLSRNAFIFSYVYHRSLLFVSSLAKMPKKQEYLRFGLKTSLVKFTYPKLLGVFPCVPLFSRYHTLRRDIKEEETCKRKDRVTVILYFM